VPLTIEQHQRKLTDPALCEQLPVRDYLDNIVVRTNGAFVAGYELSGLASYFASDEGRDRGRLMLEALLRSLPEQSMRVQFRYEVVEDLGDLLDRYIAGQHSESDEVIALDDLRIARWRGREVTGCYMRPLSHVYFIWDPVVHHRVSGKPLKPSGNPFSLSPRKCIDRSRQEHGQLVAEYESLLRGVETALDAAELSARRLTDEELFIETKRALNPLAPDPRPYKRGDERLEFRSAREQLVDVSLADETETYLNLGGVLYSFVSLKELPDATFPGILRELVGLDFPIIVNAQLMIPDQAKVLKGYKSRLRKMQAAQRDSNGGFRTNVEAQVAETQLVRVQQDIISSSVKTAKLSFVIGTRTSRPAVTTAELEESERRIDNQRQQLLYAVARMNGAKAVAETLAKKRLFFGSLPAMADADKRDQDLLTSNAADLLPVEMPWRGTPRSPLLVLETPYRQLIPFSPFDPGLSDANMLVMAKTGGGKTTLLRNIITQDLFRVVGPPDNPHRIPMLIFDGKADKEFLSDLLPAIETAGRMHQLRVLDPSRPDISARYNPFFSEHGLYQEHANLIFESFDLKEDFFHGHQATYLSDLVRVLAHTGKSFNIYDVLVVALDQKVLSEQIAVARSCLEAQVGIDHQRRLNFEMSVRNLQQSFADRERVPKIQGLLNELMTFLEDDLSLITGAYDELLSLDEVIDQELILFVSLNTNKNSKAVTALGRMLLQNMQLIIGKRYENEQVRRRENRPMVSVILDEFAPFAYSNFSQILQTARGTNTAFLFALQSLPQLLKVGRGFKDDVSSAPNTTMLLHTRDEETTQYFLKASARVRQKRRTLTVQRTGVFEEKYEPIGFGSETDIKETRSQDEHIKNLPVGQMEILMTDQRQGTLHSHLHVRVPRNNRFPGLEPRIYPRLCSASHLEGANLRFKDRDLAQRNGHLSVRTGRLTWM
jgi:hypothetical protein